ncbi:MAG: Alanyl-tRNA synthetase, partial [uncultured Rubrobacteraceae bacterium]
GRAAPVGAPPHAPLGDALRRVGREAGGPAQRHPWGRAAPVALPRALRGILPARGRQGHREPPVLARRGAPGGRHGLPGRRRGPQEVFREGPPGRHGPGRTPSRVLRGAHRRGVAHRPRPRGGAAEAGGRLGPRLRDEGGRGSRAVRLGLPPLRVLHRQRLRQGRGRPARRPALRRQTRGRRTPLAPDRGL